MDKKNSIVETYSLEEGCIVKTIQRRDGSYSISKLQTDRLIESHAEDYDLSWLRSAEKPSVENPERTMTVVDLFSGTGPMTLGVIEGGRALNIDIRPIYAIDFVDNVAQNYKLNFPDCLVNNGDINDVIDGSFGDTITERERQLLDRIGTVDFLIGGPPCQGHSDLNNHTRRNDPRNDLILKVTRFAEITNPEFVIIENVQGIRHDKNNVLEKAKTQLRSLGYNLYDNLLMSSKYGVPQNRRRFILVGSKRKIDFDLSRYIRTKMTTTSWAIADLVDINAEKSDTFNTSATHSAVNQERIDYLFQNGIYELPNFLRPKCQQKENNSYNSVYGRMYPNQPAPTITSGFGSIGQGRFAHPEEPRSITPHEAARLQFIPDFFKFEKGLNRVALQKMIGNAVPPKLTYIITVELLR